MTVQEMIRRWKPIQMVRRQKRRLYFESKKGFGTHWGVFASFDEAAAHSPSATGFNRKAAAFDYDDRLERIFPYDYPILFWLERILVPEQEMCVFDIGGGVGVHYYAYKKYLTYPATMRWRVCEVDEVIEVGRARARNADANGLDFTNSMHAIESGTDVLLAAGALHYIERPLLWDVLAPMDRKPPHILLNKLPLYDGDEFVSLQNIGSAFAPLNVWNRRLFVERFTKLGYRLVDTWAVPERKFELFDEPGRRFSFSGVYFRLA